MVDCQPPGILNHRRLAKFANVCEFGTSLSVSPGARHGYNDLILYPLKILGSRSRLTVVFNNPQISACKNTVITSNFDFVSLSCNSFSSRSGVFLPERIKQFLTPLTRIILNTALNGLVSFTISLMARSGFAFGMV